MKPYTRRPPIKKCVQGHSGCTVCKPEGALSKKAVRRKARDAS